MEAKPIWQSKTLWFNILGVSLGVLQILGDTQVISPENLTLAMGVGNVLLRFVTNQPVSLGGKGDNDK